MRGWLTVVVVFAALVALKLVTFEGAVSGFNFYDELGYVTNARTLVREGTYPVMQSVYPPLYPLALTPAVSLGAASWYEWVLRTNALLSSAVVLVVYLIARRLLRMRLAVLCAVLAAVLPYHWVYPRAVFSENLYGPLFLVAAALVVAGPDRRPHAHALVFGVVLALCQLTRHLTLAVLPVLFGGYVWFHAARAEPRRRLTVVTVIAAGFVAAYAPWVLYACAQGSTLGHALGFGIAGDQLATTAHAPGAVAGAFLPWLAVYALTGALILSPYAPTLLIGRPGDGERAGERRRLMIVAALTLLAFASASMVFQWRFFADARAGAYIEERYFLSPLPLVPILALSALAGVSRGSATWRRSMAVAMAYVAVLGLVYGGLLSYRLWVSHPSGSHPLTSPHLASAGQTFGTPAGRTVTRVMIAATGLLTLVAVHRSRFLAITVLTAGVVAGSAVGAYRLTEAMNWLQGRAYHGRMMARALAGVPARGQPDTPVPIWLGEGLSATPQAIAHLTNVMQFWDVRTPFTVQASSAAAPREGHGLFVTLARRDAGATPRALYTTLGRQYAIYGVGDPGFAGVYRAAMLYDTPLQITAFGPRYVRVGQRFSVQPDGSSALWLSATGLTETTTVVFNGVTMPTNLDVEMGLVVATVPLAAYATPGEYPVVLRDDATRRVSAPVRFVVRGGS